MTDPLAGWWQHQIGVERYSGDGARGPLFDAPVTIVGMVEDGTSLIVGTDGEQITSTARVAFPAGTAAIPVGSRVTLPAVFGSRVCTVGRAARADAGAQPVPAHLELALI